MTSLTVLRRERNRIHRTAYSRIVKTQGHSEQLGATQKLGASGNIQQASRLASAPVCAVPTAHRRPDCCPRPDRSTSSSPGVVLWVTMVDLGLFFRQFKVEVPRAHWSGGRAAGMCGCVEPTSGILVSGGRRAHQFPFSWRHIHHALPNPFQMVTRFDASSSRVPSLCQAEKQPVSRKRQPWVADRLRRNRTESRSLPAAV